MNTLISVIGGSTCSPQDAQLAEEVGRELALRGATVVCGGLTGVMEAVCRGAYGAGGHTIALLPGDDPAAANAHVEFAIPTGLGHARNVIIARAGRAVIAIAGSHGTLSELALALVYGTPVVALNTWDVSLNGAAPGGLVRADTAQEAVELALALAAARG
jgi:hypothetical protein